MKILKKILAAIGILAVILCGIILLCAVNPSLTDKIASFIPESKAKEHEPDVSAGYEDEVQDEEPAESVSENNAAEETTPEQQYISNAVQEPSESGQEQQTDDVAKGAAGYIIPSESDVSVPEAVSGKTGYEPITQTDEELTDAEGGENTSTLGYGETGDGLTFDAGLYPYYQMLDDKGKHLYRQIYANALALNKEFAPVESVPVSDIKDVVESVYNDHPELFWLNTAFVCKYDKNKICAELGLDFNELAENLSDANKELGNRMNEILTQVQNLGSNYEKEKAVHDILIDEITYNTSADMNQSVYSALVNGETVCAGYARAMQYLMQRLGIPCYYCTGYAGQNHAWNIVRLDDGYYNVDVTWDDTPGGEYDYFNRTDAEYAGTHVRQSLSVNLPVCEAQTYYPR
jgi:transglutaminase-like putative cysteine protease